jgi:hypothetical protein
VATSTADGCVFNKYVVCMAKVWPAGVPHTISNDDEYRGMHIPAGTIVLGSAWYAIFPKQSRYYADD